MDRYGLLLCFEWLCISIAGRKGFCGILAVLLSVYGGKSELSYSSNSIDFVVAYNLRDFATLDRSVQSMYVHEMRQTDSFT